MGRVLAKCSLAQGCGPVHALYIFSEFCLLLFQLQSVSSDP